MPYSPGKNGEFELAAHDDEEESGARMAIASNLGDDIANGVALPEGIEVDPSSLRDQGLLERLAESLEREISLRELKRGGPEVLLNNTSDKELLEMTGKDYDRDLPSFDEVCEELDEHFPLPGSDHGEEDQPTNWGQWVYAKLDQRYQEKGVMPTI